MGVTCCLLLSCLGLAFTAQAQQCSRPVGGPNLVLKGTDILLQTFPDGSKVTFTCDVGYSSAGGSGSSTCTAGSWSRVMLKCERKNCGPAGEVANGQIDYPDGGTLFGDSCVVICNPGYILVGKNVLQCGDGGWIGRLPVCEVVICDPPPEIVDGTFKPNKETYDYRDVVQYSCNKDYSLDGSNSRMCSDGGTFVPDPPKCTLVQCEDPVIRNGEWVGGSRPPHKYKATVTYRCNSGYNIIGEGTLTCEINSQWSPGLPECEPAPATTKATTTTTTTTTATTRHSSKKPTVPPGPTSDPADNGSPNQVVLVITVVFIFIVIVIVIAVICGFKAYKKKRGFRSGYPDKVETIHMERQ